MTLRLYQGGERSGGQNWLPGAWPLSSRFPAPLLFTFGRPSDASHMAFWGTIEGRSPTWRLCAPLVCLSWRFVSVFRRPGQAGAGGHFHCVQKRNGAPSTRSPPSITRPMRNAERKPTSGSTPRWYHNQWQFSTSRSQKESVSRQPEREGKGITSESSGIGDSSHQQGTDKPSLRVGSSQRGSQPIATLPPRLRSTYC